MASYLLGFNAVYCIKNEKYIETIELLSLIFLNRTNFYSNNNKIQLVILLSRREQQMV